MDFDFYTLYKDFSTAELLTITQRPDEYQPEAVEAANLRLSERNIAHEDQVAVQAFYAESDRAANRKTERIDQLKGQAADLFQPVFQPSSEVAPQKWFRLFLLVLGLQYGWSLIQTLIAVYKTIAGQGSDRFDLFFLIDIGTIIYLPYFYYLLYKRKRWGWILVFAGILVGILGLPMQVYAYSVFLRAFGQGPMDMGTIAGFVFQGAVKIVFAMFLWRQDVCDLFGIRQPIKTRTVVYTSVITLLVSGGLLFLTRK